MNLIQELQLENLTEEEKNEVLTQFTDSLLKRLIVRVYGKLNSEDQQTLDSLGENKEVEKINAFLEEKVPDLDQLRDEEMRGLAEEMKDFLAETKT